MKGSFFTTTGSVLEVSRVPHIRMHHSNQNQCTPMVLRARVVHVFESFIQQGRSFARVVFLNGPLVGTMMTISDKDPVGIIADLN